MTSSSNSQLSSEDKVLTNQIIDGSTKLIFSITSQDPSKFAKAARHQEPKSLATTSMSINIPPNKEFRPSDIRETLPEEIKSIHRSDLSRIVGHHNRINRVVPTENFHVQNKRGHPKKYEVGKPSGPKKYYKPSPFENSINLLLSNPKFVELIYKALYKQGLLFELEKWTQLYLFHVIRNYDTDTAWRVSKSVFPLSEKGTKFEEEYLKIRGVQENELEKLAEERAKLRIKKKRKDDYLYIFKNGAYYFKQISTKGQLGVN